MKFFCIYLNVYMCVHVCIYVIEILSMKNEYYEKIY